MYFCLMIIITGAAGFIGSCLVSKLNSLGKENLILVDDFSSSEKNKNLLNKSYIEKINRYEFFIWFSKNVHFIKEVYHIGARTDTTEQNIDILNELNLEYSKKIWNLCATHIIPLIYASSAATYGSGQFGFDDNHKNISRLKPLNAYGRSKNEFDKWVLAQDKKPPFWAGFKFFNVYGPNEFHKGRMASVIFHAFSQIKKTGKMNLFKSHKSEFNHGEQLRDFIYVKDLIEVLYLMMNNKQKSGIYNLGTGQSRTFLDLVNATFSAMKFKSKISFIDIPLDIRTNYQYYTEAKMQKLNNLGIMQKFTSLEDGIEDYVKNYLLKESYF